MWVKILFLYVWIPPDKFLHFHKEWDHNHWYWSHNKFLHNLVHINSWRNWLILYIRYQIVGDSIKTLFIMSKFTRATTYPTCAMLAWVWLQSFLLIAWTCVSIAPSHTWTSKVDTRRMTPPFHSVELACPHSYALFTLDCIQPLLGTH